MCLGASSCGSWERIRIIHIHPTGARYRLEGRKQPFKQTRSTENNVAERMWPEVNQRINYPVKRAMNEIIETDNTGIFGKSYFQILCILDDAPYY